MKESRQIALNYGLGLGMILLAINVVLYLTGSYNVSGGQGTLNTVVSIGNFALMVLFATLAIQKYKASSDGFLSIGQGFRVSFMTLIISSIITALWLFMYTTVIEPNYQEKLLEQTISQVQESGQEMTEEQLDMTMDMTERFTSPLWLSIMTIISSAFFGAIVSIILALIFQKQRPISE